MAKQNSIRRIVSSPIVQTFLIYLSGGWIVLEMTDYFIRKYDLNERISDVLSIILLIGLPMAIFLAWFLSREKEEREEKASDSVADNKSPGFFNYIKKKPQVSISGIVILILIILAGIRLIHLKVKTKWAVEQALPEIERHLNDRTYINGFELFMKAEKYIKDHSEFEELKRRVARILTIITEPAGADVFIRKYGDTEGDWQLLGTSPLDSLQMPNFTFFHCKIVKEAYEPVEAVLSTSQDTLYRKLHKIGTIPQGMVHVDGFMFETARHHGAKGHNFFLDKFEVSNKKFKAFIDSQGYNNPAYWKHDFILEGRTLGFDEAIDLFIDKTGRPGPATWEASDYPEGLGNYPVNGISWYEAAAYAEFAGKDLPTVWHWFSAVGKYIDHFNRAFPKFLLPLSNLQYNGPVPVGSTGGVGCYGSYDMAGNVREWCWNQTQDGRVLMGGAWNDISYMYTTTSQAPPFNRSPKNGFRCVSYTKPHEVGVTAFQQVDPGGRRDFYMEEPVSDEVFNVYRNQFLYDKTDLRAVIEERDESAKDWIREKITFDAAYENKRMIAYLYLPKEGRPPYQTLVFYPGDGSLLLDSISDILFRRYCNFLLINKIAVLWPIYYGTYERSLHLDDSLDNPRENHTYTEYLVKWVKDFRRSMDYLETRGDIDQERIGYHGHSWGGLMGAIIPAVEDRLKLSVLVVPGMYSYNKALPEADVINYITRVKIPVLMLNGKYDFTFVYETDVEPMYNLFGTPANYKDLKLYDTDHYVPKTEIIKETLNWLEKYFGPVQ